MFATTMTTNTRTNNVDKRVDHRADNANFVVRKISVNDSGGYRLS